MSTETARPPLLSGTGREERRHPGCGMRELVGDGAGACACFVPLYKVKEKKPGESGPFLSLSLE